MTGQAQLHPVGAAEGVAEEGEGPTDVSAGTLGENHRFSPVSLLDLIETPFHRVQSLVPADALEPALAPLSHPLERVGEAIGVVDVLGEGQAPGAEAAAGCRGGLRLLPP